MKKLAKQLIRLGEQRPDLRDNLRPILDELSHVNKSASQQVTFLATVALDSDFPAHRQKHKMWDHFGDEDFEFLQQASTVGRFEVTDLKADDKGFLFDVEADVDVEYLSYDVDAYVDDLLVSMDHDADELVKILEEQVALDALEKLYHEAVDLDPEFRKMRKRLSWWGAKGETGRKIKSLMNQKLDEIKKQDRRSF